MRMGRPRGATTTTPTGATAAAVGAAAAAAVPAMGSGLPLGLAQLTTLAGQGAAAG